MRKEDVDQFATRRPFAPFEIRLVDGQRFRFTHVEQLMVGRTTIATLSPTGHVVLISIAMIATIRPLGRNGRGRRTRTA